MNAAQLAEIAFNAEVASDRSDIGICCHAHAPHTPTWEGLTKYERRNRTAGMQAALHAAGIHSVTNHD